MPGTSYQDIRHECNHEALSWKHSPLIKILKLADVTVRQLFFASHSICSQNIQVKVSQAPDSD